VMLSQGTCNIPGCRYAHSQDELRVNQGLLKSKMCSFYLHGQCVVGEACRFAHSSEELVEASIVQIQATYAQQQQPFLAGFAKPRPRLRSQAAQAKVDDFQIRSSLTAQLSQQVQFDPSAGSRQFDPSAGSGEGPISEKPLPAPVDEPMKVVIAASWAEDLQDDFESVDLPVPAETNLSDPQTKSAGRKSKARRILINTMADLDNFGADLHGMTIAVAPSTDSSADRVVVNGSPGLMDLSARQRQPVIVIDIEDAQELCQGCNKFTHPRPQIETMFGDDSHLVTIRKRSSTRQSSARARSSSCSERSSKALGSGYGSCSSSQRASVSLEKSNSSLCRMGHGIPCDAPAPACALCRHNSETHDKKTCAFCSRGLRVIQQNTFLTIAEEDADEFAETPLRRTQSF